ncbi:hypothetical protein F5Y05DRAFT_414599 [Hypoxylon sp. FL0543]|nr:hypothetical protein F5Y05DRAFT_414599 [Hypoxylon sp. FL0543]
MAYYQEQSIFFRLPLELREKIYEYCRPFYMGEVGVGFPSTSTDYGTLLQRRVSDTPALLQSCKRIGEEAKRWLKRHIHIEYNEHDNNVWLHLHVVGKPDLERVENLTLTFWDVVTRPTLLLNVVEHIFDHAPRLLQLEITWDEMAYCPLGGVISLEDNIEPWIPILAKAKQLKTLKLKGVKQEWAAAIEERFGQHNPDVKLDCELYDMKTSLWATW